MNVPQVRATRAKIVAESPRCFTACIPSKTDIPTRVWYHESFWRGRAGDRETHRYKETKQGERERERERESERERTAASAISERQSE